MNTSSPTDLPPTPGFEYRPEIKVLDCTIRDGGLINDHLFEDSLTRAVYEACVAAGIDYMELGYKADNKIFARDKFGAWKHCYEEDLRRVVGENDTDLKLSVMADAEKTEYRRDIVPKEKSVIDIVRVATYIYQIPTAVDMIKDAHEKGYEVSVNLMAVSTVPDAELQEGLDLLAKTPVDIIVLVDSFGALLPQQIRDYTRRYLEVVKGTGKQVGIHCHNNLQLAFANTIEAATIGANRLDATMNGIGRGAGNCSMELLLSFMRNGKYHIRPILQCIQDHFVPLREKLEWGCMIPYLITAHFNQHPRSAIILRAGQDKDNFVEFYDQWAKS
ncbi:MAG: nucleoid-structuring protein H-NS [Phycisphaerae bacterium SM23_30]|nr:MAG: nucleoid-structuring protein H-NS [Phycisphaerae bacterium SM23_30]